MRKRKLDPKKILEPLQKRGRVSFTADKELVRRYKELVREAKRNGVELKVNDIFERKLDEIVSRLNEALNEISAKEQAGASCFERLDLSVADFSWCK